MVAAETRETGEPRRTPWLFLAAAGRMEPASTATETPGDSRVEGKRRRVGLGAGEAGRLFGHVWFCRRGDWTQDAEIRESDVRSKYESGNRHVQMVFESRRDDIGRDTKARDGLAVTAPRPGGGGRPRRGPRGSSQHEPGGHVSETPAAEPRVRAAPGRHVVILMACCAHLPELVGGKRGGHTQPPLVGLL